jgi:hypothetical protein
MGALSCEIHVSDLKRRGSFTVGAALFVVVFAMGWRQLPTEGITWVWLAVSLAIVPIVMVLNGMEYQVAARLLAHRVPLGEAMRISVLGSIANLLPVPGAILVRAGALRRRGASVGGSAMATGAVGAGWLGLSALVAGLLLMATGSVRTGGGFVSAGLVATIGMLLLVRRAGGSAGDAALIVALEGAFVSVSALRTWATLHAIGGGDLAQAAALTVAAPIAAAAGILPGGLGLREVIAGALGPLVGLAAATGVVAAGIDRLLGVTGLGAGAWLFLGRKRNAA